MFCPSCGQQQASEDTRFCSRCGFLLTGTSHLIASGGVLPQTLPNFDPNIISPRKRGLKQGGLLLIIGMIIVPLVALLVDAVHGPDLIVAVLALVTFWGGILRMLYALFFESKIPQISANESVLPKVVQNALPGNKNSNALPPQQTMPVSSYESPVNGNWRDTKDFAQPSVTEHTTKFFERDK